MVGIKHDLDYIRFLLNVSRDIVDNVELPMQLGKDSSLRATAPKTAAEPMMSASLSMAVNPASGVKRRRRDTSITDNSLILFMGKKLFGTF